MKSQRVEERISMRTNPKTKRFLTAAALLSGYNNLTSFILATAHKEAQRILHESKATVLSDEDRDLVLNLLKNPPEPGKRLKALLLSAEKRCKVEEENRE